MNLCLLQDLIRLIKWLHICLTFKNLPRVYLLDIETGIQEVVGDFPGMTFAPRFSPDGKKIIMSFAKDGNSDIYTMNLENRIVERITNHPSIDTSPFIFARW